MAKTVINEFDTVYAPPDTAITDTGVEHSTIQDAVDNADSWVLVGPGTFNEAVTIGSDDFDLIGSGHSSIIDATDTGSRAIITDRSNTTIRNLQAIGDPNESFTAIRFNPATGEDRGRIYGVLVADSGGNGINMGQTNGMVSNCFVFGSGNHGIRVSGSGSIVSGVVVSGVNSWCVEATAAHHLVVTGATFRGGARHGLRSDADESAFGNISMRGLNGDGLNLQGNDVSASNMTLSGCGGDAVTLSGSDIMLANIKTVSTTGTPLTDGTATNPAYSNVVTDGTRQDNIAANGVTDDTWIGRLVDSPNGNIPNAVLDDAESAEISVPVPDGETLKVYRWGAYQISDGTTPTDLDVELLDGSDTVQATANTGNTESTDPASPVASHANSSGSASVFKLAVANDTGSTISDPGVGAFFAYLVE